MSRTEWVTRLRGAVTDAGGLPATAEFADAWSEVAHAAELRVTLVGPWSAGKSSIIKRLLVEDGTAVPEWLTISASRETYEIREATSGRYAYVDTPGLGSDERNHDRIALSSIARTDLLVVAITPQLLGTDVDRLAALLDGTAVSPAGGAFFPPNAIVVLISKADMAGVDPIDDLDGYQAIIERKRASVVTALRRSVNVELPPVIAVIADLGGQHARNPRPLLSSYEEARQWDGISHLRAVIAAAADDLPRLRAAAQLRHWARAGALALENSFDELAQLDAQARRIHSDRLRIQVLEDELDAIDASCASRLRDDIRDQMHTVITQGGVDSTEQLAEQIGLRVNASVGAWHTESTGKLVTLARRAQVELRPPTQPGTGPALDSHIEQLVKHATVPADTPDAMLGDFVAKGLMVADKMQELRLGIKAADVPHHLNHYQALVDQLSPTAYAKTLSLLNIDGVLTNPAYVQELSNLEGHDGVSELISYLRKPGGITSPGHAEKLRNATNSLRIAADVAPVLIELLQLQQQDQASQHQRDKRAQLQGQADGAATRLARQILAGGEDGTGWRGQVAELRQALRSSAPTEDTATQLTERARRLTEARADLGSVLHGLAAAGLVDN